MLSKSLKFGVAATRNLVKQTQGLQIRGLSTPCNKNKLDPVQVKRANRHLYHDRKWVIIND